MKIMKTYHFLLALLIATLPTSITRSERHNNICHTTSGAIEKINVGAWYRYKGHIGSYKVTFQYEYVTLQGITVEELLSYHYDSVGKDINLRFVGKKGRYAICREYVNGRLTGTFKIIITPQSIVGSFTNNKNQTFKVNAKCVDYGG